MIYARLKIFTILLLIGVPFFVIQAVEPNWNIQLNLDVTAEDFYQRLGLSRKMTTAEIKEWVEKHRKEIRVRYHPDLHGGDPLYSQAYKGFEQAMDTLSDYSKRERYDNGRFAVTGSGNNHQSAPPPPQPPPREPPKPKIIEHSILLTLDGNKTFRAHISYPEATPSQATLSFIVDATTSTGLSFDWMNGGRFEYQRSFNATELLNAQLVASSLRVSITDEKGLVRNKDISHDFKLLIDLSHQKIKYHLYDPENKQRYEVESIDKAIGFNEPPAMHDQRFFIKPTGSKFLFPVIVIGKVSDSQGSIAVADVFSMFNPSTKAMTVFVISESDLILDPKDHYYSKLVTKWQPGVENKLLREMKALYPIYHNELLLNDKDSVLISKVNALRSFIVSHSQTPRRTILRKVKDLFACFRWLTG